MLVIVAAIKDMLLSMLENENIDILDCVRPYKTEGGDMKVVRNVIVILRLRSSDLDENTFKVTRNRAGKIAVI